MIAARRARSALVAAVHLFLLDGERVLLSLRQDTGYADGQWSVVAGHLDGNETVSAVVSREACEEAGIALAPDDLAVVGIMHRRAEGSAGRERLDFPQTARVWRGTPTNLEPEKCAALAWYPLDALPQALVPYVRRALANYRQGRCSIPLVRTMGVSVVRYSSSLRPTATAASRARRAVSN